MNKEEEEEDEDKVEEIDGRLVPSIQIFNGDMLEVGKDIEDNSIDLIYCDLPYGVTNCKWDTVIPLAPMWELFYRTLKPKCAIILHGSQPFLSMLISSNVKRYCYDWYWNKRFAGNFVQAKRQPLRTIEPIAVFSHDGKMPIYFPIMEEREKPIKRGGVKTSEAIPVKHNAEKSKAVYTHKYPTNILDYNVRECRGKHPTQKPVTLAKYIVETYTRKGDTVFDGCMGSGTVGVASIELKRNFVGIEKEEKYFEVAKRRLGF